MFIFAVFIQNFDAVGSTEKGKKISQPAKISHVAKFCKPEFSQAVAKIRKRTVAACTEGFSI